MPGESANHYAIYSRYGIFCFINRSIQSDYNGTIYFTTANNLYSKWMNEWKKKKKKINKLICKTAVLLCLATNQIIEASCNFRYDGISCTWDRNRLRVATPVTGAGHNAQD